MLLIIRHYAADVFINYVYPLIMKRRVSAVKKDVIKIFFLSVNVSMSPYQGIYELLAKEKRFKLFVVLTTSSTYFNEPQAEDLMLM